MRSGDDVGHDQFAAKPRHRRLTGVDRILVLPLYPQFSRSTTAAVFDRLAQALKPCPHLPELRLIRDYHDHPAYIDALANSVRDHWARHGGAYGETYPSELQKYSFSTLELDQSKNRLE